MTVNEDREADDRIAAAVSDIRALCAAMAPREAVAAIGFALCWAHAAQWQHLTDADKAKVIDLLIARMADELRQTHRLAPSVS